MNCPASGCENGTSGSGVDVAVGPGDGDATGVSWASPGPGVISPGAGDRVGARAACAVAVRIIGETVGGPNRGLGVAVGTGVPGLPWTD